MQKQSLFTWVALTSLSLSLVSPLSSWAQMATARLTDISADNGQHTVTLQFSAPVHANLQNPYDQGNRQILLDIKGANLNGLSDADVNPKLQGILAQLKEINQVSLNEFPGQPTMVRLAVKTPESVSANLNQNDNRQIVVQLVNAETPPVTPKTPTTSLKLTPGNKPSVTPQKTTPIAVNSIAQLPNSGYNLLGKLDGLTPTKISQLVSADKAYQEGKMAQSQQNWALAESKYRQAYTAFPQAKQYALGLAEVSMEINKLPQAREVLETSLRWNQDDGELLNALGKVSLLSKDDTKAVGYFKQAIPTGRLSNYASSLRRTNKIDQAEAVYKVAIDINPADSDLQFNLGNLYLNAKRFNEAQQRFQEAIRLSPSTPEAHFHLGLAYIGLGQAEPARRELNQYLQLAPNASNKDAVAQYLQQLK